MTSAALFIAWLGGAFGIGSVLAGVCLDKARSDRWSWPEVVVGAIVWPFVVGKFLWLGTCRLCRRELLPKPSQIDRLPAVRSQPPNGWDNWQVEKQRGQNERQLSP
jgi:hypothetical protein